MRDPSDGLLLDNFKLHAAGRAHREILLRRGRLLDEGDSKYHEREYSFVYNIRKIGYLFHFHKLFYTLDHVS